jgi:hypothetical protein
LFCDKIKYNREERKCKEGKMEKYAPAKKFQKNLDISIKNMKI